MSNPSCPLCSATQQMHHYGVLWIYLHQWSVEEETLSLLLKKVDAGAVGKPGSCNGCLSFSISSSTATLAEPVLLTHYSTQLRSGSQERTPITIIIVDDVVGTRGATASKFLVSISTTLFWIHLTTLLISILIANKSFIWKRLICIEN